MLIKINNLRTTSKIGVFEWEKNLEREIVVNFEAEVDCDKCSESDSLNDTVDYGKIYDQIKFVATSSNFNLIEKLADTMLLSIMEDKRISSATIELHKLKLFSDLDSVSVKLTKTQSKNC